MEQAPNQRRIPSVLPPISNIEEVIQKSEEKTDRAYATAFREQYAAEPDERWDVLGQVFDFLSNREMQRPLSIRS
jgi:hypothetical protein